MSKQFRPQMQCKVCFDAGKSKEQYSNHWVKDKNGKVVCPTLLSQKCLRCDKSGHTVKFCTVVLSKVPVAKVPEKRTEKKELPRMTNKFSILDAKPVTKKVPTTEDFPELPMAKPVAKKETTMSYVTMASKMPEVVIQERMEEAEKEKTDMVNLMDYLKKPKEERKDEIDKYNDDCFYGRNGLGWADMMDSDEEDLYRQDSFDEDW